MNRGRYVGPEAPLLRGPELRTEADGERVSALPGAGVPGGVLVVGEAPGRDGGPILARAVRKVPELARLPRTNLLEEYPGPGPRKGSSFPEARAAIAAMDLERRTPRSVALVLLGTRVASAFGLRRRDYEFLSWRPLRGRAVAVSPHPSGIVRWWNDPANRERAREFFRELDFERAREFFRELDFPGEEE